MSRWRSLLCRVLGHQWTPHPPFTPHGKLFNDWTQVCRRCPATRVVDLSSPYRRLTLWSWRYILHLLDRLSQPAIERASRRGWGAASDARTSPSPKAADTGSASAPSGASR